MGVSKLSISFDAELGDEVRQAAQRAGVPVSTWLADAARAKLRSEAFVDFLAAWEREHGALTEDELREAEEALGLRAKSPAS